MAESVAEKAANDAVAVVGLACLFPGARSAEELWRNVSAGFDAVAEVPAGRFDPVFYEPGGTTDGASGIRFSCRRGGFVDGLADFDPTAFGIMPVVVDGGEPDQFIALAQAGRALEDSGGAHERVAPDRVGVIVGRGGYVTPGVARLGQRTHVAQQLVAAVRALVPGIDEDRLVQVHDEFQRQLGPVRAESSIGLVPNLVASRIANRFDFQGPAYTLDAACASALVAVDHACLELRRRRCDLVLAGATHHCHDVTLWSVFTQLGALSPSQQIRPFSRHADGILVGEGTALFVLKRLADAERDGDRVYAVVRGTGTASDGRASSLMSPSVSGQVLALERAWDSAGLDPATVGLVEAHGTGTPVGDEAELESLRQVFGKPDGSPLAGLGSIKSMIGHAMPAAGAAGLAKAVLALHHRVLPPTLHADEPHPLVQTTRFRLIQRAEPWDDGPQPRRAGVNAFGFGGINAHVVLEEHPHTTSVPAPARRRATPRIDARSALPPTLLLAGADASEVARRLADWSDAHQDSDDLPAIADMPAGGLCRLAVVDVTARRVELARRVVEQGEPWRGRNGVWFEPRGLLHDGGQLAFLFPGVEPDFAPRLDDVAEHFGLGALLAPLHDDPPDMALLERQSRGIIAVGRLLHRVLRRLDVAPDMVAGHSLGEWSAEFAAGVVDEELVDEFLAQLQPGAVELADVVFLALGCGAEAAREVIEGLGATTVSHDNCPHQAVVCGPHLDIQAVAARCRARGVLVQELPFRSGFHSPAFADHLPALRAALGPLPMQSPALPLWSATTCQPYPTEPDQIRALAVRHLVEPVRFRELLLAMYDAGARVFVQVGLGSLTGFVDDTLRQHADVVAVPASTAKRSGLEQLCHLAAALWTEGHPVACDHLVARAGGAEPSRARPLDLGSRLVRELTPLEVTLGERAPNTPGPADDLVQIRRLALDVEPAWADHAFYRQPEDWPYPEDRFPLVPMTGIVEILLDAARELHPGLVPLAVEDLAALRWLTVDPPVEVTLRASTVGPASDGTVQVKVGIDGHARATVTLGDRYPDPPGPPSIELTDERPSHIPSERFYADRHMFHGPAYQGVRDLLAVADDGSRAVLENLPAPGALLDSAGQLMGHWLSAHAEGSQLVLPTGIERLELFGPPPPPGARLDCTMVVTHIDDRALHSDLHLAHQDRLWCRITGWKDRRFPADAVVFEALKWPERSAMSIERDGYALVHERWSDGPTRDLIMRRYLGRHERAEYERHHPLGQRQFLLGRIALKDAVRRWLWAHDERPLFPAEVVVADDAQGRPLVRGPFTEDLRVSLAQVEGLAVGVVHQSHEAGVDLEKVEPRRHDFEQVVLSRSEQELTPPDDHDRDTWLTCLWAVKEAAARATGRGLQGRPKDYEIVELTEQAARVGDRWIAFERLVEPTDDEADTERKEHIVAWTTTPR